MHKRADKKLLRHQVVLLVSFYTGVKLGRRKNLKTKLATQQPPVPNIPTPLKIPATEPKASLADPVTLRSEEQSSHLEAVFMIPDLNLPTQEIEHGPLAVAAAAADDDDDDATLLESIANQTFSAYESASNFPWPCHPTETIPSFENVLQEFPLFADNCTQLQNATGSELYSAIFSRVTEIIEHVVKFCKQVPGFKDITIDDQMHMLKCTIFEIISVHAAAFKCLVLLGEPTSILPFTMLKGTPLEGLFGDVEQVSDRLTSLQLTGVEFSLVCGILLFSAGTFFFYNQSFYMKYTRQK